MYRARTNSLKLTIKNWIQKLINGFNFSWQKVYNHTCLVL